MKSIIEISILAITLMSIGFTFFILPSCSPVVVGEVIHEAEVAEEAVLADLEGQAVAKNQSVTSP